MLALIVVPLLLAAPTADNPPVITPVEAAKHVGELVIVQGTVDQVSVSSRSAKPDAVSHQGAEEPQPTEAPTSLREPVVSVLGGLGNACGGLGIQGDYYLAQGRLSVFGGVGYFPASDSLSGISANGIAGAVGARLFTKGLRYRGFLELAVEPVAGAFQSEMVRLPTKPYCTAPLLRSGTSTTSRADSPGCSRSASVTLDGAGTITPTQP
jgi:hypothetical protein